MKISLMYRNLIYLQLCMACSFIGCSNKQMTSVKPKPKEVVKQVESKIDTTSYGVLMSYDGGHSWSTSGDGLPKDIRVSYLDKLGESIVAASDNYGIFIKERMDDSWQQIGKSLPEKKVNALHIQGEDIYVGLYQKGIFVSSDIGASWKPLNFDLADLRVQSIMNFEGRLIIGTDDGIFELSDTNTWKNLFYGCQVNSLTQYRSEMIAGTSRGALVSKNSGNEWEWIYKKGAVKNTGVMDDRMALMTMSNGLYIANHFYITSNFGSLDPVPFPTSKGSSVYEIMEIDGQWFVSNNFGLHRSIDKGKSWERIIQTRNRAFFDFLVTDNIQYCAVTPYQLRGC
ncbi:MAG: hypothetical protein JXQ96_02760 [Cyclobacteriaceae bacterium]